MDPSLIFLYILFGAAILMHIVAGILTSAFVLPLQYKEAQVKNGLGALRIQLLKRGVLGLTVIVVSIISLTLRFVVHDIEVLRYVISFMIFLHGFGTLGKSIIDLKIYHQNYSPEQKRNHEILEQIEKGELKVVPIKKTKGGVKK